MAILRTLLAFLAGLLAGVSLAAETSPDDVAVGVATASVAKVAEVLKESKTTLPTKAGAYVLRTVTNGPAAKAGLAFGDIISSINGKPVRTDEEFLEAVRALEAGKTVPITGYTNRANKWKHVSAKITPQSWRDVTLGALDSKVDEVSGITSYTHVDSPKSVNERSELYAYVLGTKEGKPTLRLRIQYVAKDWLFIESFLIKAGEKSFTLAAPDMERDNGATRIWEWYDAPVTAAELAMLETMTRGTVTLRQQGDKYKSDRELSRDEQSRLQTVLDAFRILQAAK